MPTPLSRTALEGEVETCSTFGPGRIHLYRPDPMFSGLIFVGSFRLWADAQLFAKTLSAVRDQETIILDDTRRGRHNLFAWKAGKQLEINYDTVGAEA